MKKNLLVALISGLCFTFLQAQDQSATQNTFTKSYFVWVNSTASNVRYLWDITDSTITVGSSKKRSDMSLKTYNVEQVKWVKVRQKGSVEIGVIIGLLAGTVVGYISGYAQGDDEPCTICFALDAETKGTILAIPGALGGAIIGGIIGGLKRKIPINGSRNTLAQQRKKLEQYKRGQ
jgi:hypothetical protein